MMPTQSLSFIRLLGGISFLWAWKATLVYGQNHITPNLPLSFFFDYNVPGQPVPVPVTEQCETIHIEWSRGSATGPNPTAPYYLQVYTSAFIQPFVISVGSGLTFDWPVPFFPGTLYQICMFDKFGNTGGCQNTYTVIPSSSDPSPTCNNVTFAEQLNVTAQDHTGPLSQFGFVDQCTDISITPSNGSTPPYTLTVAPALHPPYNITSLDQKPINWTVSLSWASPFFISLVDAKGALWSNGPLHSGGGGTTTTDCLTGFPRSSQKTIKPSVAVGTGIGGLAAGLIIGAIVAFMFLRRHLASRFFYLVSRPGSPETAMAENAKPSHSSHPSSDHGRPSTVGWSPIGSISSPIMVRRGGQDSTVRPFMVPDENERATSKLGRTASASTVQDDRSNNQNQVYVIHHDSSAAPVTIYHQTGTQIVELPPRYPRLSTQDDDLDREASRVQRTQPEVNPGTLILNQPRRPGEMQKSRT